MDIVNDGQCNSAQENFLEVEEFVSPKKGGHPVEEGKMIGVVVLRFLSGDLLTAFVGINGLPNTQSYPETHDSLPI